MTFRLLALAIAMMAGLLLGQTSGTIGGVVKDESGAAVPNAKVLARSTGGGESRETVSGANGQYVFPLLTAGAYQLEVSLASFGTAVAQVVLGVTERVAVDIVLRPSSVRTDVDTA